MPVDGVYETLRAIGKERTKTGLTIAEALEKAANVVLAKSQEFVPVDTGDLKQSGRVVVEGKGLGAVATVVYGGAPYQSSRYAIFVHEDMTKFHAPPTRAKFLEAAVKAVRGVLGRIVQRELEVKGAKPL